ncbi:hypothetical protein ACFWJW_34415 [Streptomyces sp. NPDC127097]|uniref:hypothetical protein n=1 Tax=Streptomyces sp. NPDC127097 TaxID=3347136 RepID=UPI003654BD51
MINQRTTARRRAAVLMTAALLAGLGTTATAGTVSAASRGAQGTAPSCVERFVRGQGASVYNNCGRTLKLKIVVSLGPDSSCHTVANHRGFQHTWSIGRYDKTVTC